MSGSNGERDVAPQRGRCLEGSTKTTEAARGRICVLGGLPPKPGEIKGVIMGAMSRWAAATGGPPAATPGRGGSDHGGEDCYCEIMGDGDRGLVREFVERSMHAASGALEAKLGDDSIWACVNLKRPVDVFSWITTDGECPSLHILEMSFLSLFLTCTYSLGNFLVATLSADLGIVPSSDVNGSKRYYSFRNSFDHFIGYSVGMFSAHVIQHSTSMENFMSNSLHLVENLVELGAFYTSETLKLSSQLSKEPWMLLVSKTPLPNLISAISAVNKNPMEPCQEAISLSPLISVVGGHPQTLSNLHDLFPQDSKYLPVHNAFHTPFYQEPILNQVSRASAGCKGSKESSDFWNLVTHFMKPIHWLEIVRTAVGVYLSVEVHDVGPGGIGFMTHTLCVKELGISSSLFNLEPRPNHSTQRPYREAVSSLLSVMQQVVSEVLSFKEGVIPIDKPLLDLGLNSLSALLIATRLAQIFDCPVSPSSVYCATTLKDLFHVTINERPKLKTIPKIQRPDRLPLSYNQQRLYFLEKLSPNTTKYSEASAALMSGNLNSTCLKSAFIQLVQRHESLRTLFGEDKDGPFLIILPSENCSQSMDIQEIDITGGDRNAIEKATCYINFKGRSTFDLLQGPLIHLIIGHLDNQQLLLIVNMHHIIMDGWSVVVFFKELSLLYNKELNSLHSACENQQPLFPLPYQYADFVLWQREWLKSTVTNVQLSYWQKALRHTAHVSALPLDRPRTNRTYKAGHYYKHLPPSISDKLRAIGMPYNSTLFVTTLSLFHLLLHRYSPHRWKEEQEGIVIGIPVANRHYPGVENLIGFFSNTLPIWHCVCDEKPFNSIIKKVRKKVLEAQDAQDIPFDWIVDQLGVGRNLQTLPLVQVMFVMDDWQPFASNNFMLQGIHEVLQLEAESSEVAKFDLTLRVSATDSSFTFHFEYAQDIFDENTISRMGDSLTELVSSLVSSNSAQKVYQLPIVPHVDLMQLEIWNTTLENYSELKNGKTVHLLFEEQASRIPHTVALKFEQQQMTYSNLNCEANKVANFLLSAGIGRGTFVPFIAVRSMEMVIGILGILKAGAAYVPIDPHWGKPRISIILEDMSSDVILASDQVYISCIPLATPPLNVVSIQGIIGNRSLCVENPHSQATGSDPIYALFTSGSTGKPKAAVNVHSAILNFILYLQSRYPLHVTQASLFKSPFFFDSSVSEFMWPLVVGATVIVVAPHIQDARQILDAVVSNQISMTFFVPTILREFIDAGKKYSSDVPPLHGYFFSGGEALPSSWVKDFYDVFGKDAHLVSVYGPTETAVAVTMIDCVASDQYSSSFVTLGKPISNVKIFILDNYLSLVPVGVVGEIYIGGAALGSGYLMQPDLTRKSYVQTAFSHDRVYKTGDLGRYLPNGEIEFHGRIDFQIKFHGIRIELGEIEVALQEHQNVLQAVVSMREDSGRPSIAAYIQLRDTSIRENCAQELSTYLLSKLPPNLIPNTFTIMESFPTTTTGKIDRKLLPAPQLHIPQPTENTSSTLSFFSVELQLLAQCWRECLPQGTNVGLHSDFFQIGGDSILALRIVLCAHERGLEVHLQDFFEGRTITRIIELLHMKKLCSELPKLTAHKRPKHIPLSYSQQRIYFLDRLLPMSSQYCILRGFWVDGTLPFNFVLDAVTCITKRHEILRTTFVEQAGEVWQVIKEPEEAASAISFQEIQIDNASETQDIVNRELSFIFNLETGPLLKVLVCRFTGSRTLLLFNIHHIVYDAWSDYLFLTEFSRFYNGLVSGNSYFPPALPFQYADFAFWHRDWLQNDLSKQLDYWKQALECAPQIADLPIDRPRSTNRTYRAGIVSHCLSANTASRLINFGIKCGATPFVTLLTVFHILLHFYSPQFETRDTGQSDTSEGVVIGIATANRHYPGVEALIGFFVNTLAIKVRIDESWTFKTVLESVRLKVILAQNYQDVPFDMVIEALKIERNIHFQPLVQVMFGMETNHDLELNGTKSTPLTLLGGNTAKCDLFLTAFSKTNEGSDGEIVLAFEYDKELFDKDTIARMAHNYETLVSSILSCPEQTVCDMNVLSSLEHHQQAVWNNTEKAFHDIRPVHVMFEEWATRSPTNVALKYNHLSMTYEQLNESANRIAHFLVELGVGEECFIPIISDRSPEIVITIFGILKTGGAFVPLDPHSPSSRLNSALDDLSPKVILAATKFLSTCFPTDNAQFSLDQHRFWRGVPVFTIEEILLMDISTAPAGNFKMNLPHNIVTGNEAVYAYFTSGTTGKPKAAVNEHAGTTNHILWLQDKFQFTPTDSFLASSEVFFDASVDEILWPLVVGACCVIAPDGANKDPEALVSLVKENDVTTVFLVPVMLLEFIEASQGVDLPHLRYVITGADSLPWDTVTKFYLRFATGTVKLFNTYGPTEASVETCVYDVNPTAKKQDLPTTCVPIGTPICNVKVFIVDKNLKPVPIGAIGEICLGGIAVGREYLKRPELTAQKFITNPMNNNSKLYRSGDLARYLNDGTISFCGRLDYQIKLSGQRIELGEIESVLTSHPYVSSALAIPFEDNNGIKYIAAYVVPCHTTSRSHSTLKEELQQHLQERIPGYMVPSTFTFLDNFPLTTTGKLNRKALPPPHHSKDLSNHCTPLFNTKEERTIYDAWKVVLGAFQGDSNSNFFHYGGTSLLTMKLVHVLSANGLHVTVRDVYMAPTISSLASRLRSTSPQSEKISCSDSSVPSSEVEQDLPSPSTYNLGSSFVSNETITTHGVFITGVTGFVGAHVLASLTSTFSPEFTFYCLVRGSSLETAKNRLNEALNSYSIIVDRMFERIVVLVGDLEKESLGLDPSLLSSLVRQGAFEYVYHIGAGVNHVASYSALRNVNVAGTRELLAIAIMSRSRLFIHMSSESVLDHNGQLLALQAAKESSGYECSKWCGEKHVWQASAAGLPVVILRPGFIWFSTKTGIGNKADWMCRLLTGILELGFSPETQLGIGLVPVDYVASLLSNVHSLSQYQGTAVHFPSHHMALSTLFRWMSRFPSENPHPCTHTLLQQNNISLRDNLTRLSSPIPRSEWMGHINQALANRDTQPAPVLNRLMGLLLFSEVLFSDTSSLTCPSPTEGLPPLPALTIEHFFMHLCWCLSQW